MGNACLQDCLHFQPAGLQGRLQPTRLGGSSGSSGGYKASIGTYRAEQVGGPSPAVTGRKRALLIGINYRGTVTELRGCVNDARSMHDFLVGTYGFPDDEVRLLVDEPGYRFQPTRANIMDGFDWLVEGAKSGDVFFFHYSGHGAQQEDPSYSEEDAMDETILPLDFQANGQIVDDEIFDRVVARLPNGCKLVSVMDCCHSGTGLDLPFTYDVRTRRWIEDDNPCHSQAHVLNFSGCCDDETSADALNFGGSPAGAMTSAFLETLQANPAPTYPQLLEAIQSNLWSRGFSQRPQLTSSQSFDAQSSVFTICDDIVPNQNDVLGRQFRKKKHPRAAWLTPGSDDLLGGLLLNLAVLDAATLGVDGLAGGFYDDDDYGRGFDGPAGTSDGGLLGFFGLGGGNFGGPDDFAGGDFGDFDGGDFGDGGFVD
mmetsp:Transcript_20237/g.47244  ORF Transcript_20237/g.47244 Transcript_20237/m.47244 type:complete len:427 (+) Transcript_20237:63-1343(+)